MADKILTPEQAALFLKNYSDPKWRLANLYYIKDRNGNKVKYSVKPAQAYLRKHFWYYNIILKSRQHGITTEMCIRYLDICLFQRDKTAAIVAQTESDAFRIFADKIKFAYDNLPQEIKDARGLVLDNKSEMQFVNGSKIYCDNSLRGGTTNFLHISEFGPMCANDPKRAAEVISGALNTVHAGNYITIESTGEGETGEFHRLTMLALNDALAKKKLTKLQFKFFFFGWYCDPENVLDAGSMVIPKEYEDYFKTVLVEINRLSEVGVIMPLPGGVFTDQQKAWYVAKSIQQGDEMHAQHPSTPEEAFKSTAEGVYYRKQLAWLHENKRIGKVPHVPATTVNTSWDLGADDYTAIWFHQKIGQENRLIDYYENYGEDLSHYARYLAGKNYTYGKHYLPHDAGAKRLSMDNNSIEEQLQTLGLRNTEVVSRTLDVGASIEDTRQFLMTCWIDEEHCSVGLNHLQGYRKKRAKDGRWKETPEHDASGHSDAADSIRTLACGMLQKKGSGKGSDYLKNRQTPDIRAFW